uniref:Bestrophin homolog n=1 Tax=Acrobeloides nanus TaxID=290746 RepID=A0A914E064_9BILA
MQVKRRFPTMENIVESGLMTKEELDEYNSIESPHAKYWFPTEWAFQLLRKARTLNLIDSDIVYIHIMERLAKFRSSIMNLVIYDWISIPIIYTQVVNLTVRCYFLCNLMGRQYLKHDYEIPNSKTIDLYVPIMTICQLVFYLGWMKAAEVMLNPFGEDDDDFECNYILDRNLEVGMLIVDSCYEGLPDSGDDDSGNYAYTAAEEPEDRINLQGSCSKVKPTQKRACPCPKIKWAKQRKPSRRQRKTSENDRNSKEDKKFPLKEVINSKSNGIIVIEA